MKTRRIVGSIVLIACIVAVSLGADNVQSNFVPGDFGPAASALGVPQEHGYYNLGAMLDLLVLRIEALEARVADQDAQIASLSTGLESLSAGPQSSMTYTDDLRIAWTNQVPSLARDHDITLVFETVTGAVCTLEVFYEGTGHRSTSPAVRTPQTANERGIVQWTWHLSASSGQVARITVVATAPDGRQVTGIWRFAVEG
ncbi:MAG: hypothetical protein AB1778_05590 [Candidatus Bipolaricaulota bacterium]